MGTTLDDGLKKLIDNNYIKLAYKIVNGQMKSYRDALKLYKKEKTPINLNRVEEIEKELKSTYYSKLALGIGIVDFEYFIKKIKCKILG